ncbi:unnamed protein product [Caenorhabditis angaria]|uniref:Uncharacterized protein n=1 Tax=Caenorhabditis angaria TaxID=860376 RepID=A0A9P1N0E3_9PELO|nr:unnamed protein product [Caenorhabditis angaria]
MIFLIPSENRTIWFPFASLNDVPENLRFFVIFELFLNIFCGFLILRCVKVMLTSRVIHLNLSLIICLLWLQWFEVLFAKIIIIPYQYGFIDFPSITSWWTLDSGEMKEFENFKDVLWLYVAALLLWHYLNSVLIGTGGVVIERLFATYFINDYEQKSRKQIPILILTTTHIFSITFSILSIESKLPLTFAFGLSIFIMITFFSAYFIVLFINQHFERRPKFSLSQKFQVNENLRALKMFRKFVWILSGYIFLAAGLFLLLIFKLAPFPALTSHVLEDLIYLNHIFFVPGLIYCSDQWHQEFWSFLPFRKRKINQTPTIIKHNDEAQIYFTQLKNAWI